MEFMSKKSPMMQAYVFTVLLFTILPFYSFSFLFELLCERLHVES